MTTNETNKIYIGTTWDGICSSPVWGKWDTCTYPYPSYSYSDFPYSYSSSGYYKESEAFKKLKEILKETTQEGKKEMLKIIDVKIGYEKRAVVDKTKRDEKGNYLAHKEEFPVTTIVKFENGRTQTAYCDKDDTFNLETGITICVAKELMQRLYGENKDNNLNKIIRSGLHLYKKLDKLAQKVLKQLEEDERIEKNRKAKEQKRRLKRAEKKKEREIEILAEAIKRANADSK